MPYDSAAESIQDGEAMQFYRLELPQVDVILQEDKYSYNAEEVNTCQDEDPGFKIDTSQPLHLQGYDPRGVL